MATFLEQLQIMRIAYKRGSRPDEINLCCPFCVDRQETEDTRFRLGVNVKKNMSSCFNCGWKSRQAKVWILRKLGARTEDVVDVEEVADPVIEEPVDEESAEELKLPIDWMRSWKIERFDRPAYDGVRYLLKRGMTLEEMKAYKIGISLTGPYQYRIVFPVYWRSKLRGLVGRDWTNQSKARYRNSEGAKYLWNLPRTIPTDDPLVLSEGCFKAWAIEKHLRVWSAALLGHNVTQQQLNQLKDAKASHIIVWPDPDVPGLHGLVDVCEKLVSAGFQVDTIWPPPRKQADEMLPGKLRWLYYKHTVPFDWTLAQKIRSYISFGAVA